MPDQQQKIIVVHRGTPGLVAGICGCIFAILGIFTLGLVFVPIAAVCSIIGLLRGATQSSLTGFGISVLSTVLSFVGLITSPSLLLLTGLAIGSHEADVAEASKASQDKAPIVDPEISETMKCPVGGGTATLTGVASKRAIGERSDVWVFTTELPFCLTVNPPIAPTQRIILSMVEIEGQAPPSNVRLELNGTLYMRRPLATGELVPVLVVQSGKRLK